jgi:hypothetical protein
MAIVDDSPLWGSNADGTAVLLMAIYLPERLQRRRLGRQLLRELRPLWRERAATGVQAAARTAAGAAALAAWGFRLSAVSMPDLPEWYLELR